MAAQLPCNRPINERYLVIEFEKADRELWEKVSQSAGEQKVYALIELGSKAVGREDFQNALAIFETARDLYEEFGKEANLAILGYLYSELGWALKELKRPVEAAEEARKAVIAYRSVGSPEILRAITAHGDFCYSARDYEMSFQVHKSGIGEPHPDADEYFVASSFGNCAYALVKLKRWTEALEYGVEARKRFKILREPRHVSCWDEVISLCNFWLSNGEEALRHAQMALDFATLTEDGLRLQWSNLRMGTAKKLLGEYEAALDYFSTAKDYLLSFKETNWEQLLLLEHHVADIYHIQGKCFSALEIRRRLVTVQEIVNG
jgi:tetratricopeptide (TPR) repeat protein